MAKQSISKRFNRSLIKIVAFLLLAFALGVAVYGVDRMNSQLNDRLDYVSRLARVNMQRAIWNIDDRAIDEILNAIFLDEDIVYLAVVTDGKISAGKVRPMFESKDFGFFEGSHNFVTTSTTIFFEKQEIAKVRIAISKANLKKSLTAQVISIILLALLLIVMITRRSITVSKKIIFEPLMELKNSAASIAGGNLDINIPHDSDDEIGSLGKSFDGMRKAVKKLITDLNEINTELEQRVEKRTAELEIAKQEAEKANESKSEFLSMMSHEIRTPMNAVIGMNYLALQTKLTAKQRDYLSKTQSSAQSLLSIINDILDFSKIEAGKLDIETVDFNLEDVLDNLSTLVSRKAEEKGLEMHFIISSDVPLFLIGDSLRLGQVLLNLTSNAVKFTESGEIIVKIELTSEPGDGKQVTLQFTVKDTGIGLTRDQLNKLFQSFSQADKSTTRKYGGTGLGLAISKSLVELMGGKIRAESEPGKGSSFIFTAEFGRRKKEEGKQLLLPEGVQGMKILVVDDSSTSRKILQAYLESFSFKVVLANSGKEAIRLLENSPEDKPFKLVLMDWKMPEMDGIKTSNLIKNNPRISFLPTIIMVTAHGREEVAKQAAEAGLEGFLVKPVNPSALFEAILGVFGKAAVKKSSDIRQWVDKNEMLEKIRGAKILLVEDNAINQQVANDLLEDAGFVVTIANNGREAVQKVGDDDFDVVLMDLEMPEMDGYAATREIRNMKSEIQNIPIIAVTAHALTGIREKCLKAGMDDYTTKPINPVELFKTLTKWIKPGERELPVPQKESTGTTAPVAVRASGKVKAPASLKGLDVREGLARINGNEKYYRDYLAMFASKYEGEDSRLEAMWREAEYEEARKKAHGLKGVAGTLALPRVHTAAAALESAFENKKSRKSNIKTAINELSDALNEAFDSIKEYVKSGESEEANKQHPREATSINALLDELVVCIREADVTALDAADKLQSALKGDPLEKESSALKKHLMEYEFDKANGLVKMIREKIGEKEK